LRELKLPFTVQKLFFYGETFYIADLYIPHHKVILEIDGKQHYTISGITYDTIRTENLYELGVNRVVRIKNEECTTNKVKQVVIDTLNELEETKLMVIEED